MASKNDRREQPDVSEALMKAEPLDEHLAMAKFEGDQLMAEGFECEVFHKVVEGDAIYGLFIGRGPDIELNAVDEKTGHHIVLMSWKVRGLDKFGKEVGITIQIPGKYELNKFFRAHTPGNTLVGIRYKDRVQIGTRQVTRFDTFYKVDANREKSGPSEVEYENQLKAQAEATAKAQAAASK
jgi:hypothetical protein